MEEISGSGKGGNSSSDGFMLFATGIANFCGLLENRCAAIIGLSCAMFVFGEFAACFVAGMVAVRVSLVCRTMVQLPQTFDKSQQNAPNASCSCDINTVYSTLRGRG